VLLGGKETIPVVQISPRVARRPDKRRTSTPFWAYVHCLTCKAKSVEIFVAFCGIGANWANQLLSYVSFYWAKEKKGKLVESFLEST